MIHSVTPSQDGPRAQTRVCGSDWGSDSGLRVKLGPRPGSAGQTGAQARLCVPVPDSVMLWTMGVISASQQVRPRASAASASGRKRSANICSCLRALFSLNTQKYT